MAWLFSSYLWCKLADICVWLYKQRQEIEMQKKIMITLMLRSAKNPNCKTSQNISPLILFSSTMALQESSHQVAGLQFVANSSIGKIALPQLPDMQIHDRNLLPWNCRLSSWVTWLPNYFPSHQQATALGLPMPDIQIHGRNKLSWDFLCQTWKSMAEINWQGIANLVIQLVESYCRVSWSKWEAENQTTILGKSAVLAIPLLKGITGRCY